MFQVPPSTVVDVLLDLPVAEVIGERGGLI
jgi:hypothetical protein